VPPALDAEQTGFRVGSGTGHLSSRRSPDRARSLTAGLRVSSNHSLRPEIASQKRLAMTGEIADS